MYAKLHTKWRTAWQRGRARKVQVTATHIPPDRGEGGLPRPSLVLCEQVTCLSESFLELRPLGGPLSPDRMAQAECALLIALGMQVR